MRCLTLALVLLIVSTSTAFADRGGHAIEPEVLGNVPHWLCLHHYEAPWTDAGDPYWGGLQMDRDFMRTYGLDMIRKHHGGLANTWTPREQVIVAERAYRTRGYQPWPNTRRKCHI